MYPLTDGFKTYHKDINCSEESQNNLTTQCLLRLYKNEIIVQFFQKLKFNAFKDENYSMTLS